MRTKKRSCYDMGIAKGEQEKKVHRILHTPSHHTKILLNMAAMSL
jgi:hypothetical protein